MLTEFNEGGSHESNPLGGIPQGQSSNGQMNTVEQNETKKGNFVYSDRLYINEDLAKMSNLPSYIKGKSFASASKAINDKFKDRNDIHSKATQKELLDRLAQSQEQLKAEQEAINQSMQVNQSEVEYSEDNQMAFGGLFTASPERQEMQANRKYYKNLFKEGSITRDQFRGYKQDLRQDFRSGISNGLIGANNGAIPFNSSFEPGRYDHKLNQKMLFQQFGGGGMMGMNFSTQDSALNTGVDPTSAQYKSKFMDFIGKNGSMVGGIGTQLGTMINPNGFMGKDINEASNVGYENNHLQNANKYGQILDGVQGAVAKSFGPVGEAVFGAKKLGEGLGNSIGGDAGAGISSFFSPEKAAIANWTDKDMKFGDKLLGNLPVIGGIKAKQSSDKKLQNFKDNKDRADNFYKYQFNENNNDTKVFRNGGPLDEIIPPDTFPNGIYQAPVVTDQQYLLNNKDKYNPSIIKDIQARSGAFVDGKPGKETYVKSGLRHDGTMWNPNLNADRALESALSTPDSEVKPDYTLDDIKNMKSSYNTADSTSKNGKKIDYSKIKDSLTNSLRYAPVLGNILQKNKIGSVEVDQAIRNPYQYKKQYIDEAAYRNAADQQSALTMEALNKSGLSGNQLLAASLGSQLARTKGVSEGAMVAKMHNLNENKIAEQVKQQNQGDYVTDSRYVRETNAQNRANRDTQMSKFDAEIYNSLGEIGKEELFKRQAEKLTGYKMMGEYMMADPNYKSQYDAIDKDSKLTPIEKYAKKQQLTNDYYKRMTPEQLKQVAEAMNETTQFGHEQSSTTNKKAYGGYINTAPKFKKY